MIPAVSFTVTCRDCRQQVLTADEIDGEAECVLRDHFMLAHLGVEQPESLGELLALFYFEPKLPPAA